MANVPVPAAIANASQYELQSSAKMPRLILHGNTNVDICLHPRNLDHPMLAPDTRTWRAKCIMNQAQKPYIAFSSFLKT
jgi:hypothetical protein